MIVTFNEIINEVIRGLGLDAPTVETRVLESVKLRINEVQDVIFYDSDWDWRKRTFYRTTKAPFTTGTVSLTKGSRTVTGSGTAWPSTVRNGYLLINNKFYKIDEYASGTSLKLKAPYDNTSISGSSYSIIFPEIDMPHALSSIVNIAIHGKPLDIKHKGRIQITIDSVGEPVEAALADRTDEDWWNVGTVNATEGSANIVGSGTGWTEEMEGMSFRVNEFAKMYTIKTVTDATHIILREAYEGATGVAKGYKINPAGTQLITLRSSPNDTYYTEIEGLVNPNRLVGGSDISLIPNHMPLIHGATWLALSDLEGKNPIRIQQARADFERSMKQLRSSYKILTNVRWRSERETKVRKTFNPLD
jgi:hypothetical protein